MGVRVIGRMPESRRYRRSGNQRFMLRLDDNVSCLISARTGYEGDCRQTAPALRGLCMRVRVAVLVVVLVLLLVSMCVCLLLVVP